MSYSSYAKDSNQFKTTSRKDGAKNKTRILVAKALEIIIVLLIVIAGFGQAVLQLWNLLMPGIFGLHRITFWQAVGLMGLSWILFGGFRGLWSMPSSRHRTRRWDRMTPEQREQFQ